MLKTSWATERYWWSDFINDHEDGSRTKISSKIDMIFKKTLKFLLLGKNENKKAKNLMMELLKILKNKSKLFILFFSNTVTVLLIFFNLLLFFTVPNLTSFNAIW